MENIRKRCFILIAIMLLLLLVVAVLEYDIFEKSDYGLETIKKVPYQIRDWHGTDIKLDEDVYKILETKSIIHRNYSSEKSDVFLSLVYYPETKVDFHAPEACLGGAGERLAKEKKTIVLKINGENRKLHVNQLVRKIGLMEELIFYWYKAGAYMGESYFGLRFHIALNKMANNNKSGALIRVSTKVKGHNYDEASKKLKSFIEGLTPSLLESL